MKVRNIDYFDDIVNKQPHKTAVTYGESNISFSNLKEQSQKLAVEILSKLDSINNPISVFLPKSIEVVVSDIAITYSGNCYMNMDVKLPKERISNIFQRINPALIITNSNYIHFLLNLNIDISIINIDELENFSENHVTKINNISSKIIDSDPYCIINTSGSTGTPKGVVLNHKSFHDFNNWSNELFNFSENDLIGSLSPVVFDIYSFELTLLITKGTSIVLIPDNTSAFPINILKILDKHNVSFIFWVPTIMVNIANMDLLSKIQLNTLRLIWFAGEVFPTKHFNYWKKQFPNSTFVNLYGPIEITLDCIFYIVDRDFDDDEPLPIGFPCENTDILILNEEYKPVKPGEEGELFVRGTSLAMGYYNNPEKTNNAFVQNPLNNHYPEVIYKTGDIVYENTNREIMFKGRKDTLIKHLGYRIELGEIEYILINKLKIIDNGCVIYNKEKKEITLVYESTNEISANDFRRILSKHLSNYMIPSKFYFVEQLPCNLNGKVDRLKINKIYLT